mmetsp:Transcript_9540/g.21252  ORF Transcript_9540/g.21252 Transcript_9540/m.21252 type:complete len:880 (+) Transcript_9540:204-2843(+)
MEIRLDPNDDKCCTYSELKSKYKHLLNNAEVQEYWDCDMVILSDSADALHPDPRQRRIDPDDGRVFSSQELIKSKKGKPSVEQTRAHWFDLMSPDLPDGTKVVVSNLPRGIGEDCLMRLFGKIGEISACKVFRDSCTKQSKGFAEIQFFHAAAAERAVQEHHGASLDGYSLVLRRVFDKGRVKSVFIARLSRGTTLDELEHVFAACGEVASAQISYDTVTGKPSGHGRVDFVFPESAQQACIRFNNVVLGGSTLCCMPWIEDETGQRKRGASCLVQGLGRSMTVEKLTGVFEEAGCLVVEVVLFEDFGVLGSRGTALVEFGDEASLVAALTGLRGARVDGQEIALRSLGPDVEPCGPSVFAANLSLDTSVKDLKDFSGEAGEVVHARALTDATGDSQSVAKVQCRDGPALSRVFEMRRREINGHSAIVHDLGSTRPFGQVEVAARTSGPAVFVSRMSRSTSLDDLQRVFGEVGEISRVTFFAQRGSSFRRAAKVVFSSEEAQLRAIGLNGIELHGRELLVKKFFDKRSSEVQKSIRDYSDASEDSKKLQEQLPRFNSGKALQSDCNGGSPRMPQTQKVSGKCKGSGQEGISAKLEQEQVMHARSLIEATSSGEFSMCPPLRSEGDEAEFGMGGKEGATLEVQHRASCEGLLRGKGASLHENGGEQSYAVQVLRLDDVTGPHQTSPARQDSYVELLPTCGLSWTDKAPRILQRPTGSVELKLASPSSAEMKLSSPSELKPHDQNCRDRDGQRSPAAAKPEPRRQASAYRDQPKLGATMPRLAQRSKSGSGTLRDLSLEAFVASVDAQWLRHLAALDTTCRGVREFLHVLERQGSSLEYVLTYLQHRSDGQSELKEEFFREIGMTRLGHKRLVNKWIAANC